ncbi:MAG: RnfABCDGE type electron transport complex subunit G [Lachnospiraceae bacterium]|nr:RnfABCDGE type electron transport complex subunit G [Lachnospiraceae bacterium]
MDKKKDTMIKDAIILCVITLVLGAVLAGVYSITKEPIEQAQAKANNEACASVVQEGDQVQDADAELLKQASEYLQQHDLSNQQVSDGGENLLTHVEIEEVHPTNNGGLVFLATATKGYGGDIGFALGVGADGAITGIAITSEAETAGLGANCENKEWQAGFKGKVAPSNPAKNMYYKSTPEEESSQVQALSGATVTTRAITNAVKGIMFFADTVRGAE